VYVLASIALYTRNGMKPSELNRIGFALERAGFSVGVSYAIWGKPCFLRSLSGGNCDEEVSFGSSCGDWTSLWFSDATLQLRRLRSIIGTVTDPLRGSCGQRKSHGH